MFGQGSKTQKKPVSQTKGVHIHFDVSDEMQTEQDRRQSLIDLKIKRQSKLIDDQGHERMQKKQKTQRLFHFQEEKPKVFSNYLSNRQPSNIMMGQLVSQIYGAYVNDQKPFTSEIFVQQQEQLQAICVGILQDFLCHPGKDGLGIINSQMANKLILEVRTPNKLKSFFILYMILYRFQQIQFKFRKRIFKAKDPFTKTITIQKTQIQPSQIETNNHEYQQFKRGELKRYLSDYLQWLICNNQGRFQIGSSDVQFWAMALNNCEKVAANLIRTQNPKQIKNNLFLAMFLVNAEDVIFRTTSELPKDQRNILFMEKQDLEYLPQCHWILGFNISVRYFHQKTLFKRVKESLNIKNVKEEHIQHFYHEFQLLQHYFCEQKIIKSKGNHIQTLSDSILEWIAVESGCYKNEVVKNSQRAISLNQKICNDLLLKAHSKPQMFQQKLLIVVQMLERSKMLCDDQKDKLISSILYGSEGVALKLGDNYQKVVSNLEKIHQTKFPPLLQRLTEQYSKNYKYRLLSNKASISNDLLAQMKHLIKIDIKYRDQEIKRRLHTIFTSFSIITHWNKQVIASFVRLLQEYLLILNNKIEGSLKQTQPRDKKQGLTQIKVQMKDEKGQQSSSDAQIQQITKEYKQLRVLALFLKIQLKLDSLNFYNLNVMIDQINIFENKKSVVVFQQRTISYIKQAFLSHLFSRVAFHQGLIFQIKKQHIEITKIQSKSKPNKIGDRQKSESSSSKTLSTLTKLLKMAQGHSYLQQQIQTLQRETALFSLTV